MKSITRLFHAIKAVSQAEDVKVLGFVPAGPAAGWKWAGIFRQYLLCFTSDGLVLFELSSYIFAFFSFLAVLVVGTAVSAAFVITRLFVGFPPEVQDPASLGLAVFSWFAFILVMAAFVAYFERRVEQLTMARIRVQERSILSDIEKLLRKPKRHPRVPYTDIKELRINLMNRVIIKILTESRAERRYDLGKIAFRNTNLDIAGVDEAKRNVSILAKQLLPPGSLVVEEKGAGKQK